MKYIKNLNINFNNWHNLQNIEKWYINIYDYTECSLMKIKLNDNNNYVSIEQYYKGHIYKYNYNNIFYDNKFKNIICSKEDEVIDFYCSIKKTTIEKLLDYILEKYDYCLLKHNIIDNNLNFNKRVKNLSYLKFKIITIQ
jgi:hypothetical protein